MNWNDEDYVPDPTDPLDESYPPAWLGCVAGITIILFIVVVIFLVIKYGG